MESANKKEGVGEWDPLNRRKEARFPVGISASVCLLQDLEGERSELGHAYVDDLSRNGLRLVTYTSVKKGEEVLVRFASPGSGARTRRVVVCWVEEQSPGRYEVGLGMPEAAVSPSTDVALAKVYSIKADFVDEEDRPSSETATEFDEGEVQGELFHPKELPDEVDVPLTPQITQIIVQNSRSTLEVAALLIVALAFFTSMGLLVAWQWLQIA